MSSTLFRCQRCNQPLKLRAMQEGPLEAQQHANPSPRARTSSSPVPDWGKSSQESACSTFSLLDELTTQRTFAKQEGPLEAQQHASPSPRARTSSSPVPDWGKSSQESACSTFSLLGELTAQRTLNTIQNVVLEISENLSGQKDVDHPLCVDCMNNLVRELDAQLTLVEADTEKYRRFVERESLVSEEEREAMNAELLPELRSLEQEEARLAQEQKDIDGQNARIEAELREAMSESWKLEQQEEEDLKEYAALTKKRLELIDKLSSVENRLADAQKQLSRLRKTDIFNMTFTILDEGPLGIINNFRLGRLPGIQVEWGEINTAWGQTALLLFSLSKLAELQFQRYQLVPCGDHSYLKSLAGDGMLPLFSDGSHRVFHNNEFDCGMKAFLDCLQQFMEEAEKKGLFLPYRIHVKRGVLEDTKGSGECCSISTHLNSEEEWAKALKFMLTNLKLILAWASSRYCSKIEPVWSHFK
ncbi:beclin-2-like [Alexandromys fortis]|uniref:beclin-2-like n=1 Tax=Alexandromys fortis TaxID=100897 RepID=UPI002152F0B7|nr:beclin-2-like [Microtus fortis]